ncbi:hypothetical protein ABPG74_022300 [Tetrahymena malaccensis]
MALWIQIYLTIFIQLLANLGTRQKPIKQIKIEYIKNRSQSIQRFITRYIRQIFKYIYYKRYYEQALLDSQEQACKINYQECVFIFTYYQSWEKLNFKIFLSKLVRSNLFENSMVDHFSY